LSTWGGSFLPECLPEGKQPLEGWQIWMFPYTEGHNCFIIFCQCFIGYLPCGGKLGCSAGNNRVVRRETIGLFSGSANCCRVKNFPLRLTNLGVVSPSGWQIWMFPYTEGRHYIMLAILLRPFGLISPTDYRIIGFPIFWLSVHDEGSGSANCCQCFIGYLPCGEKLGCPAGNNRCFSAGNNRVVSRQRKFLSLFVDFFLFVNMSSHVCQKILSTHFIP
jgi:hypothetical protein